MLMLIMELSFFLSFQRRKNSNRNEEDEADSAATSIVIRQFLYESLSLLFLLLFFCTLFMQIDDNIFSFLLFLHLSLCRSPSRQWRLA